MASMAITALSSIAWISGVSANIAFVLFPKTPPTIVNPGDSLLVTWRDDNANVTVPNLAPFDLTLRAITGQRYNIQGSVPQTLGQLKVVIPKEATGGLHSFYAIYSDKNKTSSNQFNVTGASVVTPDPTTDTALPTSGTTTGGTIAPTKSSTEESSGLSGAALGGIIGGVVAFLLLIALIFFFRHRRLVREQSAHTRLEDTKETYSETASTARSAPTTGPLGGGGGKEDGMVAIPLSGAPGGARSAHPEDQGYCGEEFGSPRLQHQQHQMQHANGNRNPFDGPEDIMGASATIAGAASLSPRQQHQPYQPPQYSQQPPRPTQEQQQPYGISNPMMQQQQRNQSPFQQSSRDSMESELESACDPDRTRMMPNNINMTAGSAPIQRNNSSPMMRAGGGPILPQLSHQASNRSIGNEFRQNMSPHPQQQQQNPFQDRELMAAAAGAGAMGAAAIAAHHHQQQQQHGANSPLLAQRQLSQNQHANQSPIAHSASPRMREIEMQPLDVQQHQYEQQQRALQRQQQQQEQAAAAAAIAAATSAAPQPTQHQQQQQQTPVQTSVEPAQSAQQTTTSAAPSLAPILPSHPFNPTLYDDKTEVDEDGAPVYNGYRDTIFGAYSQPIGDDDDDDDEQEAPVPVIPPSALASSATKESATDASAAPTVTRKKSVKFTGVPSSGPIEVPASAQAPTSAAVSTPAPFSSASQSQMYHSEEDDGEDYDGHDDEEYEEDEDDIKLRLMETEVPSPSSAHAQARPPYINTATSGAPSPLNQQQQQQQQQPQQGQSMLSPIRSPNQATTDYNASFVPPPPASQGSLSASDNLAPSSSLGDGFYEDVLAAVDKNAKSLPSSTSASSPTQQQPMIPPPVPQEPVQQQHIPSPVTVSVPVPIEKQVFGAPSPRMKPASVAVQQQQLQQQYQSGGYPSPPKPTSARPALSPRSAARPIAGQQQQQQQQHRDDEEAQFYESSLL
ncbi:hypothetical protein EDD11_010471 [Mortierella claussenii]|nr:hypothetical protein EDD11_010471 [Mortierella claussenii]